MPDIDLEKALIIKSKRIDFNYYDKYTEAVYTFCIKRDFELSRYIETYHISLDTREVFMNFDSLIVNLYCGQHNMLAPLIKYNQGIIECTFNKWQSDIMKRNDFLIIRVSKIKKNYR